MKAWGTPRGTRCDAAGAQLVLLAVDVQPDRALEDVERLVRRRGACAAGCTCPARPRPRTAGTRRRPRARATSQVCRPPAVEPALLALAGVAYDALVVMSPSPGRSWDSSPMTKLRYREADVNVRTSRRRPDPAEAAHPGRAWSPPPATWSLRADAAPTVAEAAEAAPVSRTTAYRYFPTQTVAAGRRPSRGRARRSMLPEDAPATTPRRGSRRRSAAFLATVVDTEPQQRTMLRLSLEPDPPRDELPLRQGRAIGWFTEALGPAGRRTSARTAYAALGRRRARRRGIESLVWLTDVAGLTRRRPSSRWSGRRSRCCVGDGRPRTQPGALGGQ